MARTRFGKAVILRQKTKDMKLGLFAIGGAWLNYRKAKAEYEALEEKQQALQAVLDTYQMTRYEDYDAMMDNEHGKNERPDGLLVSSILRVSNLTGKMFYARSIITFTNAGEKPIFVKSVTAQPYLDIETFKGGKHIEEVPVYLYRLDWNDFTTKPTPDNLLVQQTIQPGETIEVKYPISISTIADADGDSLMEALRYILLNMNNVSYDVAGKRYMTSCPPTTVQGMEKANILVYWAKDSEVKNFSMVGVPGVFQYCGETSTIKL